MAVRLVLGNQELRAKMYTLRSPSHNLALAQVSAVAALIDLCLEAWNQDRRILIHATSSQHLTLQLITYGITCHTCRMINPLQKPSLFSPRTRHRHSFQCNTADNNDGQTVATGSDSPS